MYVYVYINVARIGKLKTSKIYFNISETKITANFKMATILHQNVEKYEV